MIGLLMYLLCAPAQAVEFGCYANTYECGGMAEWPAQVARMRAAGMTTAVIWARSSEDLTFQVESMLDGGMLEARPPLLVIVETSERGEQVGPVPSGWAPGEMAGQKRVIDRALAAAKRPEQWPELLIYGPDEPGHGDPNADLSGLLPVRQGYSALGLRVGGSVEGANVLAALPYFDLIAIASEDGYATREQVAALREAGKGFWVYDAALVKRRPWTIGVQMCRWCAWNPECYLFWSWQTLLAQPEGYQEQWLWAFGQAAAEINRVRNHILPGVPR